MRTVSTAVPSASRHSHLTVSPPSLTDSCSRRQARRERRGQLCPQGRGQVGHLLRLAARRAGRPTPGGPGTPARPSSTPVNVRDRSTSNRPGTELAYGRGRRRPCRTRLRREHHHRNVQGGTARAAVFGVSDGLVSNVAAHPRRGRRQPRPRRGPPGRAGRAHRRGGLDGRRGVRVDDGPDRAARAGAGAGAHRAQAQPRHARRRELAQIYQSRGVDGETAEEIADQMIARPRAGPRDPRPGGARHRPQRARLADRGRGLVVPQPSPSGRSCPCPVVLRRGDGRRGGVDRPRGASPPSRSAPPWPASPAVPCSARPPASSCSPPSRPPSPTCWDRSPASASG